MGEYTVKLTHDSVKKDRVHLVCMAEDGACNYADVVEGGAVVVKGDAIDGVEVIDPLTVKFSSSAKFRMLAVVHRVGYRDDKNINLRVTASTAKDGVVYSCKFAFKPSVHVNGLEVLTVDNDRLTYSSKEVLFEHLK